MHSAEGQTCGDAQQLSGRRHMPGPQTAVSVASQEDRGGGVPGGAEGASLNARHGPEVLQARGSRLHLEDPD